ncbi:uncharacterized protein [Dysidea avara]|uniref:uncharacterized protein isoform X2 n=1 Tax=Dysidea avara TaxID=196820 RepID=UPI00331C0CF0
MIRSSYNYVDFDTVFFVGALGIESTTTIKKPGHNAKYSPRHNQPSINAVKSDVRTFFATSGSSEGDNEMSSSSDATVAVTMRGSLAAYQPVDAKKRLSKIPVPGALGPPKTLGLHRANSLGSRSAPSSGSTTPVPPEHNKVVYRNKASGQGRVKEDTSTYRHSMNEQNFRSLPSSTSTSPANKRKSGALSSNSSSNSLTSGSGAARPHSNVGTKKAHNGRVPISKTSSASTPEEVKKAFEKDRQAEIFSKPSGNRQTYGMQKSSSTSSRSQSQSSSRSVSPNEPSSYTFIRRSTMPSKRPQTKQVSKETSALARLASRITQWAQRSQNDPEPRTNIKRPQTNKPSTRTQEIPARKTPSPYDRTSKSNVPVRRSSFKLKGSRGSISSTGSVSPIDIRTDDTTSYQHSDRDTESPLFDTETPMAPTSPLSIETPVRGDEASSFESSTAYVETSSSSMNSNTATPIVTKRTPKEGGSNRHSPYYIRMAGTSNKTSELGQLIGELNLEEIEGAVSMEADEYRRMAQEVKALKTVLLKLKRELQADHQGISPVSSTAGGKVVRARRLSPTPPDLTAKVDHLTQEKRQLNSKLEKAQKDLSSRDTKVEELEKQLKGQQEETKQLKEKLSSLEKHREYLLDKVERLHADKHKLEYRLSMVENDPDIGEVLSDLEISDDEEMEHLKHLQSESYDMSDGCMEENSDPESQAAMTGSLQ